MTKKETTKQPRDESGKFAKMIKVEDKYGNVAYFTPEEMAGFKVASPKNPDCEPATKGYVKSLIRKTRDHTHRGEWDGLLTTMALCGGWLITFILGAFIMSGSSSVQELGNKWFIPFFLFSIAISCMFVEFMNLYYKEIEEATPKELQKYTPPRKDECEEEN